jgi:hypothetical protein
MYGAGQSPASLRVMGHDPQLVQLRPVKYPPGVDDSVVVSVVSDELEAEVVCGLLRSAGIECGYRDTAAIDSPLEDFTAAGAREVLVNESDLEAARAVLAEAEG